MRYVPGRVFKSPSLPELGAGEREGYYMAMCRVLATIHSVDVDKVGLGDFGKKGEGGREGGREGGGGREGAREGGKR